MLPVSKSILVNFISYIYIYIRYWDAIIQDFTGNSSVRVVALFCRQQKLSAVPSLSSSHRPLRALFYQATGKRRVIRKQSRGVDE